eukprot:GHVU01147575.1.p2 GENE.GHVU01147575.1~~GHVU01147575.1.p2  ORF type:complete len:102 (+),score=0.94 GHVU01147575.1:241-546(+)
MRVCVVLLRPRLYSTFIPSVSGSCRLPAAPATRSCTPTPHLRCCCAAAAPLTPRCSGGPMEALTTQGSGRMAAPTVLASSGQFGAHCTAASSISSEPAHRV